MTDQEWQEGIERALNAAWFRTVHPASDEVESSRKAAAKAIVEDLARELPLRITLVHTNKDKLGHFRVGPADGLGLSGTIPRGDEAE